MDTLSPTQFKALYKDDFIQSIKLIRKRSGVHVPITFAEVIDVTGDLVVYYHHEGFGKWILVGVDSDPENI